MIAAAALVGTAANAASFDIHAGRVIDPGATNVLTDQRIRIVDGKIASVAPWREGDGPAAVDWSAYTVLPGLIDLHTHLADGAIEPDQSDPADPLKHSEADTILKGAKAASIELRSGFTTVRDVGVYRGLTDVALRDAINAGEVEGPRMFVAGGYITVPGGGGEINALAPDVPVPEAFRMGEVRNPAEARDRARYFLDHGADFIKLIATGAVLAIGGIPGAMELIARGDEGSVRRGQGCTAPTASRTPTALKGSRRQSAPASARSSMQAISTRKGSRSPRQYGVWLDMDIYNGDWINDVGVKQGWPAEYLRKNVETTDVQRRGFAAAVKAGREDDLRHRCGRLHVRARRAPVRLHGALRNDPDAGDPVGDERSGRGTGKEGQVGCVAPGAYGDLVARVRVNPLADIRPARACERRRQRGKPCSS